MAEELRARTGGLQKKLEHSVIDGNRGMRRTEASGTPWVGEGGPGALWEGGSRCVLGREQEGGRGGQGQLRDGQQGALNTGGRWARPSLSRPQL